MIGDGVRQFAGAFSEAETSTCPCSLAQSGKFAVDIQHVTVPLSRAGRQMSLVKVWFASMTILVFHRVLTTVQPNSCGAILNVAVATMNCVHVVNTYVPGRISVYCSRDVIERRWSRTAGNNVRFHSARYP